MEYITVKELFKITKGKKVEEIDYKNENSISMLLPRKKILLLHGMVLMRELLVLE